VVTNEPDESRYEITADDTLAGFAEYVRRGDNVIFTHTEIDPAFGGRGLATELIRAALDDVRANELHAVPLCPFVVAFIDKHPGEYDDLVNQDALRALGPR